MGRRRCTRSLLGQERVDLAACLGEDLRGLLALILRTGPRDLHGRADELHPGVPERTEPLGRRTEVPRRVVGALAPLLQLGLARVGDRVDALAVLLLAPHEPLLLEELQGRVDRPRARSPHATAALLELLDQVVAVHRPLRDDAKERDPHIPAAGASWTSPST